MKAGSLQEVQEISCLCVEINFAKNKSKKYLQFFKRTFLRVVYFRTVNKKKTLLIMIFFCNITENFDQSPIIKNQSNLE